jgi:homogentisate 1,2-dioxygenase
VKLTNTLAFMFETRFAQQLTEFAARAPSLHGNYADCWKGLEKRFDGRRREVTGR